MKKMFLAAVVFSAICISGCKNPGSGDPKAVLLSFFDALAKKDFDAARKLATADSKSMFDMMEMGMKMAGNMVEDKTKEKYDKANMEIGDAKIDGDKATVNVKEKKSGESVNFTLKKESGDWKVAFDMASMAEMGMQKMKEKGISMDSIRNGLEKFQNMNTDSLKDIMNKGMKTLDSIQKTMKTN